MSRKKHVRKDQNSIVHERRLSTTKFYLFELGGWENRADGSQSEHNDYGEEYRG